MNQGGFNTRSGQFRKTIHEQNQGKVGRALGTDAVLVRRCDAALPDVIAECFQRVWEERGWVDLEQGGDSLHLVVREERTEMEKNDSETSGNVAGVSYFFKACVGRGGGCVLPTRTQHARIQFVETSGLKGNPQRRIHLLHSPSGSGRVNSHGVCGRPRGVRLWKKPMDE
jgi:hypothetical protein